MNPYTKKITPVFTPFIEGKWGDNSVKDMSVSLTELLLELPVKVEKRFKRGYK